MTARIRKHCGGMNCEDSRSPNDNSCECSCEECTTCTCGCMEAGRQGFEEAAPGVYFGRGAGYRLVKRRFGWDVLDPEGRSIVEPLPASLDLANAAAVKHAREAGHGHP